MGTSVYVANVGIISAIGNNLSETLSSFEKHQSGVAQAKYLKTKHDREFPLAEVKLSNEELAQLAGLDPRLSRTILLSYVAAREALEPFDISELNKHKVGFISASTVGGMDKTEFFFEDFLLVLKDLLKLCVFHRY